jgi:hypothetical protein
MLPFDYSLGYKEIDFRKDPSFYRIGRGEQGVLLVEPYKSEILPFWRFKTPLEADVSSRRILIMFYEYCRQNDFVGADMARKFLQMGWTRARRYANHPSGHKYMDGMRKRIRPQDVNHATCAKADSASIFKKAYDEARSHVKYRHMYDKWRIQENNLIYAR